MRSLAVILGAVLLLSFSRNKRIILFSADAPRPIGPYSQAIKAANTVYVSGQIGLRADGTADTASIEDETRRALLNLEAILASDGLTMRDVCKVTIYCTNIGDFQKINNVYAEFFHADPPARETVGVRALPMKMHVEVSAIAVR